MSLDKLDLSFKKLVNREYTVNEKAWYEETGGVGFKLKGSDVWVEDIPETPPETSTDAIQLYNTLTLTEDSTVSDKRCWLANDDGRIGSFISPRYGSDYSVVLYNESDEQIYPTDVSDWFFDYETGILTFGETPSTNGPFKVKVYRYIGRTADDIADTYGVETISEDKTFSDNVHIEGTLTVDGDTELGANLGVTGDGTIDGDLEVKGALTVDSTSLFVDDAEFSSNVVVDGNLTVKGTTTTIGTKDLVVTDNRIVLNDGEEGVGITAGTSGIEIDRGTLDNVLLYFDEEDDQWKVTDALNSTIVNVAFDRPITVVLRVDGNRTDSYTENGSVDKPYKTISAAISASAAGDIILIDAGTYAEDLTITSDVTLRGNGDVSISGTITQTACNLTLVDVEITNSVDGSLITLDSNSTLTIKRCILTLQVSNVVTPAISSDGEIFISDSEISAPSGINATFGTITIKDSTISSVNDLYVGSYGINLPATTINVDIHNNTIKSFAVGLIIGNDSNSIGTGPTVIYDNHIEDNTVDINLYRAVQFEFYRNVLSGVTNVQVLASAVEDLDVVRFDDNEFLGTTGITNTKTETFTAINNWWGDSTGPNDDASIVQGAGAIVGASVVVEPFITRSNRTSDIRNTSTIPGHTLEDALDYLESTASPTTNKIHVDPLREDEYTADGSAIKPFKTIAEALSYIAEAGDNSETNGYVVSLAPATYTENVVIDSTSFVNIVFDALARESTIFAPDDDEAILCDSNNDSLITVGFNNITFNGDVVMTGENTATTFGGDMVFNNCEFNSALKFTNVVSPVVAGHSNINGDVVVQNVSYINFVGTIFDAGSFTATVDTENNIPNSFADMSIYLSDCVSSRDITWDVVVGSINCIARNSVIGSSDSTNITIPANVILTAANCTLLGDYTANGTIDLRGSFITGKVLKGSGTLSLSDQPINQIDWPVTHVFYVDGSRDDEYTEDGSLARPYKTIASAITAASSGDVIQISTGTYTENITADGVSLIGMSNVVIAGTATIASAEVVRNIKFTQTCTLDIPPSLLYNTVQACNFIDAVLSGEGSGSLTFTECIFTKLTISDGSVFVGNSTFYASDTNAIVQIGGTLRITDCYCYNNSESVTISSTGGVFEALGCKIFNAGAGDAVSLSNDATTSEPNILSAITSNSKAISTTNVPTIVDTILNATISSTATNKTNIILQPASQIANDTDLDPDTDGYTAIDISNGNTLTAAVNRLGQVVRYDEDLEAFIIDPVWANISST